MKRAIATGRTVALAIGISSALVVTACGPSAEAVERARVLAAIDALRESPSTEATRRLALAEKLANEPAKAPEAIRARDACAKAYRLLAESNQAELAAEKGLNATDKDSALGTLNAYEDAVKKLQQANETMTECGQASTALRLKG